MIKQLECMHRHFVVEVVMKIKRHEVRNSVIVLMCVLQTQQCSGPGPASGRISDHLDFIDYSHLIYKQTHGK